MQAAEYEIYNNMLVVHLKTDLDHHSALAVRETADRLLEKSRVKNILFDFGGIDFMDSSGIGVIMGRYRRVIFLGGRVGVTGVGPNIARILMYSGLNRIIEYYENAEHAFLTPAKDHYVK